MHIYIYIYILVIRIHAYLSIYKNIRVHANPYYASRA